MGACGESGSMAVDIPPTRTSAVGILAAQRRVYAYIVALKFQRVEVVGNRQQVHLGRQTVRRMAPVAVGEQAQLAALHQSPHRCSERP